MQLIYRGVSYNFTPSSLATQADRCQQAHSLKSIANLIYRGIRYVVDPDVQPAPAFVTAIANLTYRGVTYALNGGVPTSAPATVQSAKVGRRNPASLVQSTAATHQNNIYRNLERRIQVAQTQGNQNLVQMLERELKQIA